MKIEEFEIELDCVPKEGRIVDYLEGYEVEEIIDKASKSGESIEIKTRYEDYAERGWYGEEIVVPEGKQ